MQRIKRVDKNICKNHIVESDSELLAWDRWVQIRKEETEHLAKKIGRPPVDLVMNILENVREDRERKIVLESAQIQNKMTIRNNVVWEDPARFSQACPCKPVFEVQRTKAELGKPRAIERVGVPKIIKETEKGITGISKKKPFLKLDADYVQYRKRREYELEKKIKKLNPYRPEMDNLIVLGTRPEALKEENFSVPTIKLEMDTSPNTCEESIVYAIQINKSIHYKCYQGVGLQPVQQMQHLRNMQEELTSDLRSSWTYYFNTPINKIGRAKLLLKNLGTVTLRYYWRKIIKSIEFIPDAINEPVFFFNKNDDVIFPGQEKYISFTFLSNAANIYKESWEMKFYDISFLETLDDKFEINLIADITENFDEIKRKAHKVKNAIEYRAIKTMIKLLVEEIITKSMNVEHQIYPYKDFLLEVDMFEMRNPEHFYHEAKVAKLKQLYSDMRSNNWELSIKDWRRKMMKLDYDDRIKYYELLKKSNRELLRPWREKEDTILQQKHRAVKLLLSRFTDEFYKEYSDLIQENYVFEKIRNPKPNEDNLNSRHYIFYLRIYSHMCAMIETCAGIISGIDLNRRIHFDFCSK